jgi:hypothetical protein
MAAFLLRQLEILLNQASIIFDLLHTPGPLLLLLLTARLDSVLQIFHVLKLFPGMFLMEEVCLALELLLVGVLPEPEAEGLFLAQSLLFAAFCVEEDSPLILGQDRPCHNNVEMELTLPGAQAQPLIVAASISSGRHRHPRQ